MSRRRFDVEEGNSDSQQSNKFSDSRIYLFIFLNRKLLECTCLPSAHFCSLYGFKQMIKMINILNVGGDGTQCNR